MPEGEVGTERLWEQGWEGHVLAQRQRLARLSLMEKLAWLEEAQQVLVHLRRSQPLPDRGKKPTP